LTSPAASGAADASPQLAARRPPRGHELPGQNDLGKPARRTSARRRRLHRMGCSSTPRHARFNLGRAQSNRATRNYVGNFYTSDRIC